MSNRLVAKAATAVGTRRITPLVKRVIRWYLAPSGLLLAAALGLLLLVAVGVGPTRVFAVAAVGLFAIFFPYRFSRQQGQAHNETQEVAQRSRKHTRRELRRTREDAGQLVSVAEDRLQRSSEQLGLRLRLVEEEANEVRDRLIAAETGQDLPELQRRVDLLDGLERRVTQNEGLADRLSRVEAMARRVATLEDLPSRVAGSGLARDKKLQLLSNSVHELAEQLSALYAEPEAPTPDVNDQTAELDQLKSEVSQLLARETDQDLLQNLAAASVRRVWLASFPRSGNHWVRCLLEDITDTVTGSAYPDSDPDGITHIHSAIGSLPAHAHGATPSWWGAHSIEGGYTGGRAQPVIGDTVFVKTHRPQFSSSLDGLVAHGSILVVRDPIDCIASFQRYQRAQDEQVTPFDELVEDWVTFHEFWLSKKPKKIIHFSDLQEEPALAIQSLFDSLGIDVSKEAVQLAVQRYPSSSAPTEESDDAEAYADLTATTRERLFRVRAQLRQRQVVC